MKSPKTPVNKVTVLLLKASVKKFEDALKKPAELKKRSLTNTISFQGAFYSGKVEQRVPKWRTFIEPAVSGKLDDLYNAGTSAILMLKTKGRIFAITFGYGRNLLKPDSYELSFGLKAALNRIDQTKLRSMDVRNYEDLVLSTRKQVSRSSEVGSFGLDVAKDLLRAVTGEPADETFAKRLAGSDSLTLFAPLHARDLAKKCGEILEAFEDTAYKKNFDWIDHLDELRDPSKIAKLQDKLLKAIQNGNIDKMHLAPTETLNWHEVASFRITATGRNRTFDDLEIEDYLEALGDKKDDLTLAKLKSHHIMVQYSNSEQFVNLWSVYNCLIWETTEGSDLYALLDGKWFRIDQTFANRVKKYVKGIPESSRQLPNATAGEDESSYNNRVAGGAADLLLMDEHCIKPSDAASAIEVCDLLSKQKQFFHVKRKTRSATLSHLFAQGTNSAQAIFQDDHFRTEARKKVLADKGNAWGSVIPAARPSPSSYEIAFAIITRPKANWPTSLPFFSQLTLMQHAKLLRGMGFTVSLQQVKEQ